MSGALFAGLRREKRKLPCPRCKEAVKVERHGRDNKGRQQWRCLACRKKYRMVTRQPPTEKERAYARDHPATTTPLVRWMRAALAPEPPLGSRSEAKAIWTLRRLYETDPIRFLDRLGKLEIELLRTAVSRVEKPRRDDPAYDSAVDELPPPSAAPVDAEELLNDLMPKDGHAIP